MRALICCLTSLLLACVTGGRLAAQPRCGAPLKKVANAAEYEAESPVDGFYEWLHRLSGPQFLGVGGALQQTLGCTPIVRVELSFARRWSFASDDRIDPDGSNINMRSLQVVLALLPRHIPVNVGAGLALHQFSGGFDTFWHPSLPVQADLRLPWTTRHLMPRIGGAVHFFPPFNGHNFLPLNVTVNREGTRLTWVLKGSVDYRP